MPRDLTDLMETATRVAPPEPHAAADVTSLAASHLRRRRAGLAGAVALVVVVAGGLGYGATRGHDTRPEPAAGFQHHRTVSLSDAVPAGSLPGYHAEPWTIPSIQHLRAGGDPVPTYRSVDPDGRLLVRRYLGNTLQGRLQVQLFDQPGASPSHLQSPPSPGSNAGRPIGWLPSFTDDGRLLWAPDLPVVNHDQDAFHLTDLSGGHDVLAHSGFTVDRTSFSGGPPTGESISGAGASDWGMYGDQYWFSVYDHNLPHASGAAYTLYKATFSGTLTKVADDVAVMAAKGGRVAWVTTDGVVMTETVDDPSPHRVPVPLTPGCRTTPTIDLQGGLGMFAVDGSVIAATERCGSGKDAEDELLAFDPSGQMLVHLTGGITVQVFLTPHAILGESVDSRSSASEIVRYDLLTGHLARLGAFGKVFSPPQGAGDYVLWYDTDGGHVARIPD